MDEEQELGGDEGHNQSTVIQHARPAIGCGCKAGFRERYVGACIRVRFAADARTVKRGGQRQRERHSEVVPLIAVGVVSESSVDEGVDEILLNRSHREVGQARSVLLHVAIQVILLQLAGDFQAELLGTHDDGTLTDLAGDKELRLARALCRLLKQTSGSLVSVIKQLALFNVNVVADALEQQAGSVAL